MMDQATIWSGSQEAVYIGMKDGGMKDRARMKARGSGARSAARLWATGFGQQASLSGDTTVGSASLSSRASGFAAGMDYEATRNFLLGFAGGYTYSNFSVSDRATSGTVEGAHAGVYGVARRAPCTSPALASTPTMTTRRTAPSPTPPVRSVRSTNWRRAPSPATNGWAASRPAINTRLAGTLRPSAASRLLR